MSTPRENYLRALDGFGALVVQVGEHEWERTTPCPPWTARQLVGHVIDGQHQILAMLRRDELATPGRDPAALRRIAGDDPAATWRHTQRQTITALTTVDDTTVVRTPSGEMPVSQLLATAVIEPLLHAWDLATAVGCKAPLDRDAVEATLPGVEALGDQLAASGMYGSARPVHSAMTPEERLLALTGRG